MTQDKLQFTALKVLRENIVMLSLMELFVLVSGLRMVDGAFVPYTNWPYLLGGAAVVPGSYFAILLIIRLFQDAADTKRERDGNVVFSGTIGYRVLFIVVVVFVLVIDTGVYHQNGRLQTWEAVFAAVMGLTVFYAWPRRIEFSNGAIRQNKILGGAKSILFPDVIGAKYDARQQCILISGKNGVTIVHSMVHAGQNQFARQLKSLTGVNVFGLGV
jgi:hypothetical protein